MAAAVAIPICEAALRIAVYSPRISGPTISLVIACKGACLAEAATPRKAMPVQRGHPHASRPTITNAGASRRLAQMMTFLFPAWSDNHPERGAAATAATPE